GTNILATVDSILRTVTESSLRRNLKLQDEEGISSLPDFELFKNITLMGYNISPNQKFTFQKGQFSHQKLFTTLRVNSPSFSRRIIPLFDTMLVPQGKGSGTPTEPHHTPSSEAHPTSHTTYSSPTLPPVTTTSIPTVTPSETTPIRKYTRRARIAQSSALSPIAYEPASSLRDVSQGEACPTDSGFEADRDRANTAKTSTLPHDSAPRVTSYAAVEGSMQQTLNELTVFCTSLQRQHLELLSKFEAQELEINRLKARVKVLEDREGVNVERSGDDAPIKGKNLDEGEAATERVSDDTEEMATVLTSMDAATVLASEVVEVPTGSGSILTAGPPAAEVPTGSDVVPTASLVFATDIVVTPYRRRKGKDIMVESETPKKKKVQEQIDAQVARDLEEQMAREDQRMSEHVARDVEIVRIHVEEELQSMIDGLDRSNETVAKYLQEYQQFASELPLERRIELISDLVRSNLGWKVKDFRGMTFEEIEAKFTTVWKQIEDFIHMGSKKEAERLKWKGLSLEQESVKKLKTSEEVTEEAKSPDEVPKEKVKEMMQLVPIEEVSASYQFFIDLLKHLDREDLNQLWALVKESLSNRPPTTKDKEIFMLVEKDYPLRKGLAIGMISYKLQVENYSRMAFPLPVIEFPLAEEVSTASEKSCHCQKKRKATAVKIAWLLKSRRNCQSKSDDSYAKDSGFSPYESRGGNHHFLHSLGDVLIESFCQFGVIDPMHEPGDSHALRSSLHTSGFNLESLSEILDGFSILLFDIVDFYWILDVLLLLHKIC
nr:hypothetical protein [Tanacetum cinerariifolium]